MHAELIFVILFYYCLLSFISNAQPCDTDSDCEDPIIGACGPTTFVCELCTITSQCNHFEVANICSANGCIECYSSNDCQTKYNNVLISCSATFFCEEPCGDNLKSGLVECDDGNLVSGDGCSSTCEIETGYTCFGGNDSQGDTCVMEDSGSSKKPTFSGRESEMGKVVIFFSQEMIIKNDMNKIVDIQLLDSVKTDHIISYNVEKYDGFHESTEYNPYEITFVSDMDFNKAYNVTVVIADDYYIRNTNGRALAKDTVLIEVTYYYEEIYNQNDLVENLQSKVSAIEWVAYSAGVLCLFTECTDVWIKAMEWFQILAQIKFLNVRMPVNFVKLMEVFDFARASSLPNIFGNINIPDYIQIAPEPFKYLEISTFFFWTGGRMFEIMLVCLIAYLLFALVYFFAKLKKSANEKLGNVFIWSLAYHVINFTFLELMLAMGLQVCEMRFDNLNVILGETIAFFLLVFFVAIIVSTFLILKRKLDKLNDTQIKNRYGALYSLYTITKTGFNFKMVYWLYFRKILFVVAYVALAQFNRIQVFSLFGLVFVEFLYFIITRPFQRGGVLFTQILCQIFLAGTYFLVDYLDNKDDLGIREFYQAGWILTSFGWAIGFVNLLYLYYRIIRRIMHIMRNEDIKVYAMGSVTAATVMQEKAIEKKVFEKQMTNDTTLDKKPEIIVEEVSQITSKDERPLYKKELTLQDNDNSFDPLQSSPTKTAAGTNIFDHNLKSIHYDNDDNTLDQTRFEGILPVEDLRSHSGGYYPTTSQPSIYNESHKKTNLFVVDDDVSSGIQDLPDRDDDSFKSPLDTTGLKHYYPRGRLKDDIPGNETEDALLEQISKYLNPNSLVKRRKNSLTNENVRREYGNNRVLDL